MAAEEGTSDRKETTCLCAHDQRRLEAGLRLHAICPVHFRWEEPELDARSRSPYNRAGNFRGLKISRIGHNPRKYSWDPRRLSLGWDRTSEKWADLGADATAKY